MSEEFSGEPETELDYPTAVPYIIEQLQRRYGSFALVAVPRSEDPVSADSPEVVVWGGATGPLMERLELLRLRMVLGEHPDLATEVFRDVSGLAKKRGSSQTPDSAHRSNAEQSDGDGPSGETAENSATGATVSAKDASEGPETLAEASEFLSDDEIAAVERRLSEESGGECDGCSREGVAVRPVTGHPDYHDGVYCSECV